LTRDLDPELFVQFADSFTSQRGSCAIVCACACFVTLIGEL